MSTHYNRFRVVVFVYTLPHTHTTSRCGTNLAVHLRLDLTISMFITFRRATLLTSYPSGGRRDDVDLSFYVTHIRSHLSLVVFSFSSTCADNIFYVVEHREIFLILLRKFDERKQCRGFLRDAVLTTHLFLKMFENFCK